MYFLNLDYVALMKVKILIHLALLFLPVLLIAQQNYSPLILEKFTDVYFKEKEVSKIQENEIEAIFSKYNFSQSDYSSARENRKEQKSKGDRWLSLQNELIDFQKKIESNKKDALENYCQEIGIDYQLFLEIKKKYRQSIQFNRQLQPYFSKKLQLDKDE